MKLGVLEKQARINSAVRIGLNNETLSACPLSDVDAELPDQLHAQSGPWGALWIGAEVGRENSPTRRHVLNIAHVTLNLLSHNDEEDFISFASAMTPVGS